MNRCLVIALIFRNQSATVNEGRNDEKGANAEEIESSYLHLKVTVTTPFAGMHIEF